MSAWRFAAARALAMAASVPPMPHMESRGWDWSAIQRARKRGQCRGWA